MLSCPHGLPAGSLREAIGAPSPLLIATGEAIPLRGLEGVPGLPGAPQDVMFLPRGDRDLGLAYQTHPGNQASSRSIHPSIQKRSKMFQ